MQLSPREAERLLIFTAAQLARRRLAEGVRLSHPDVVALACDVALERARAGDGYEAVRSAVRGIVRGDQLWDGVADLLDAGCQVEATFADGTRLVALDGLVAS